jgi:hypothetical protein
VRRVDMKTYSVLQKYRNVEGEEVISVSIREKMNYDEAKMYVNRVLEADFELFGWEYNEHGYKGSEVFICDQNGSYYEIVEEK